MLPVRVVMLPSLLREEDVVGRSVVVFDVLRATTTIANAIHAGVKEIRIYGALDEAKTAAGAFAGDRLLAGEHECLPPDGFDLGNSPADFTTDRCADRTMFLSTTNGTKALVAARNADQLFTGSLVNARATAQALKDAKLPVTLLCAGTRGEFAMEDLLGAGCVIDRLDDCFCEGDPAHLAYLVYRTLQVDVADYLKLSTGGKNIARAKLMPDIDFAARVDHLNVAVKVVDRDGVLVATRADAYA